jgi:hypothetical protein
MKSIVITLALLVCFGTLSLSAQEQLAIGDWKSFLPHTRGFYVTETPDRIFYVSNQTLTRFDKSGLNPKFLSTIDGLSEVGVSFATYNETADALVVVYKNSNLDIIYEDEIININDISRNTQIPGDRSILNVYHRGQFLYLATGFGVVAIDVEEAVITSSVFSPQEIRDVSFWEDQFVVSMGGDIYTLPNSQVFNFEFWSLWSNRSEEWEIIESINHIETFENTLFLASDSILFAKEFNEDKTPLPIDDRVGDRINFLQAGYNYLLTGIRNAGAPDDKVRFYKSDLSYVESPGQCHGELNHAIETKEGRIFYGDNFGGFRFSESPESNCEYVFIDGPSEYENSDIDYRNGILAIAGGGPRDELRYEFSRRGMYFFKDNEWTNVSQKNTPLLADLDMREFFRILVDPFDGETIWVGTYWGGVIQYNDGVQQVYTMENSCLEGTVGDSQRERIAGMAFDDLGNLWLSNFGAPQGLKVFRENGDCEGWNVPTSSSLVDLEIDQNGFLWARIYASDAGILVFDPDPEGINGERFKSFSRGNSALPTNEVTCLTVDRSGNVWVGTSEGVVLFACGGSVFDFDCSSRPVVDETGDGVGDFLLNNVPITAIDSDGANRKWVGTEGGIIVLSPSGNEELMSFNTDNSPLFSNSIVDFSYDKISGIMYIATDQGVMAYKTETTGGEAFNSPDAYIYPNPVRPEYEGPIAIKGVAEDALIKITDLEGRLIHESRALGGQAIWDGTQWNGERVASGVYLVWVSGRGDFNQPSDAVLKLAVIR